MEKEKKDAIALSNSPKGVPIHKGAGIMLQTLQDLLDFSAMLVKEGAAPKGMSKGSVAIAIQAGLERGLGPMGGLQLGMVINGRFSWGGQGAAALIRRSGLCQKGTLKFGWEGEGNNRRGWAIAHHVDYDEPKRSEFTVSDAVTAGLWPDKDTAEKSPWVRHPNRMLMWRAFGFLARDDYSDVLGGFPIAEEAVDFVDADEITIQPPPPLGAQPTDAPAPTAADPLMGEILGKPKTETVETVEPEPLEAKPEPEPDPEPEPSSEPVVDVDLCPHGKAAETCPRCEAEDQQAILELEMRDARGDASDGK